MRPLPNSAPARAGARPAAPAGGHGTLGDSARPVRPGALQVDRQRDPVDQHRVGLIAQPVAGMQGRQLGVGQARIAAPEAETSSSSPEAWAMPPPAPP